MLRPLARPLARSLALPVALSAVLLATAACGPRGLVQPVGHGAGGGGADPGRPVSSLVVAPVPGPDGEALAAARSRWEAAAITDYDYRYRLTCMCNPDQQTATVRAGVVSPPTAWTMEALFDRIDAALRDAKRVDVSYDPVDGHPVSASVDLDAMAYDGGFGIVIESFTPRASNTSTTASTTTASTATASTATASTVPASGSLDDARRLWAAKRPAAYRMTYQRVCFCPQNQTTVVVDGDRIVSSTSDGTGNVTPVTVDDMLAELVAARAAGAAEVHITFDPSDGHPLDTYIDRDRRIADEESGYHIISFELFREG